MSRYIASMTVSFGFLVISAALLAAGIYLAEPFGFLLGYFFALTLSAAEVFFTRAKQSAKSEKHHDDN